MRQRLGVLDLQFAAQLGERLSHLRIQGILRVVSRGHNKQPPRLRKEREPVPERPTDVAPVGDVQQGQRRTAPVDRCGPGQRGQDRCVGRHQVVALLGQKLQRLLIGRNDESQIGSGKLVAQQTGERGTPARLLVTDEVKVFNVDVVGADALFFQGSDNGSDQVVRHGQAVLGAGKNEHALGV